MRLTKQDVEQMLNEAPVDSQRVQLTNLLCLLELNELLTEYIKPSKPTGVISNELDKKPTTRKSKSTT